MISRNEQRCLGHYKKKWMIKLRALLVLNGEIKDLCTLSRLGDEADFILCADGGANYCFQASLLPDRIIGDLDSISGQVFKEMKQNGIPIEQFPTKKDATDAELSIDYLIERGFKYITIVGAMGSRMDHTLGNVLLLNKMLQNNISGRIMDDNNIIYLVDNELKLEKDDGVYISLIPITDNGAVVTLEGFEYELNESRIDFASTLGISNRIVEKQGHILVHRGRCLIILSRD